MRLAISNRSDWLKLDFNCPECSLYLLSYQLFACLLSYLSLSLGVIVPASGSFRYLLS